MACFSVTSCDMHAAVMPMEGGNEAEKEDVPKSILELSSFYDWPSYLISKKGLIN